MISRWYDFQKHPPKKGVRSELVWLMDELPHTFPRIWTSSGISTVHFTKKEHTFYKLTNPLMALHSTKQKWTNHPKKNALFFQWSIFFGMFISISKKNLPLKLSLQMPMELAQQQEMPVGWTQRAADCHRAVDLGRGLLFATCFRVISFCGVVG